MCNNVRQSQQTWEKSFKILMIYVIRYLFKQKGNKTFEEHYIQKYQKP